MAPKFIRSFLVVTSLAAALAALPPAHAHADSVFAGSSLPTLPAFMDFLKDGESGVLRGVYVPDVLADGVVQQPTGEGNFVSPRQGYVTQFDAASALGSTGLLAHNFLAGASFSMLQTGTMVYLVYGDGKIATFIVTDLLRYQALQPDSPYSEFIDLGTGSHMSSSKVFSAVYGRPGELVLQTCIAKNGIASWGRLFVVAEPYEYRNLLGIDR